jgi:putative ABC transport system permease protein
VLTESLLVAVAGGAAGLAAAWLIVQNGDPTGGLLAVFTLPARDLAAGAAVIVILGLLAGLIPALGAMRIRITDALRKV